MFELFMMCLFAGIGMLLGNLVFNCIVALSDYMDNKASDKAYKLTQEYAYKLIDKTIEIRNNRQ